MSERSIFQSWEELCQRCDMDTEFGYLISPTYQPKTFDASHITAILSKLNLLIGDKVLIIMVKQVPEINCQEISSTLDLFILKQMLGYILMGYLETLLRTQQKLVVPANIARPFHYAVKKLQISYGFGSGISFNWRFRSVPKQLHQLKSHQHIQSKWYVTSDVENQRLLFGFSAGVSIFMFRALKLCYQVSVMIHQHPEWQNLIVQKLKKMCFWVLKASDENLLCLQFLDPCFLVNKWGSVIKQHDKVFLEGVDIQIKYYSGNAGYDPLFNAFEAALGLDFSSEQAIIKMKQKLIGGMINSHLQLRVWMQQNSLIRQYCEVTSFMRKQYNKVLKAYSMFFKTHSSMIANLLERHIPQYNKDSPPQKSIFYVIYSKSTFIQQKLLKI